MMCNAPIEVHHFGAGYPIRCGKCMPCRITKRKMWTSRIVLENMFSTDGSCFVTLTYNDRQLPALDKWPGGTLVKSDLQKFFKRLRKNLSNHPTLSGSKVRYFAVGEYGSKSHRAHYHAIIFGLPFSDNEVHKLIDKAWNNLGPPDADGIPSRGFVYVGDVNAKSAAYCANYTTKKLSGPAADDFYDGRLPEFLLTSKRPGLGYTACREIARLLAQPKGRNFILDGVIRLHGAKYPLDEFMLKHISRFLYDLTGRDLRKPDAPPIFWDEFLQKRHDSGVRADRYVKALKKKEKL